MENREHQRAERLGALRAIRRTLAADMACEEDDFTNEGVTVHEAKPRDGRMQFPFRNPSFAVMTMGQGVVVSCNRERLDWARTRLVGRHRDAIFAAATLIELQGLVEPTGQFIAGPDLKYVCSSDPTIVEFDEDVRMSIVTQKDIPTLYNHQGFGHALTYGRSSRSDLLAVTAHRGSGLIGIAAATADSEELWQIGVDVVSSERGRGVGKMIVAQLARSIRQQGKIPYYSTAISNIQSRQLAVSLGFWPAWVQVYARDQ